MKTIIGVVVFILLFTFSSLSQIPVSNQATPYDIYVLLDTVFQLGKQGFDAWGVPSGLLGDTVLARAYKEGITFFGSNVADYKNQSVSYLTFSYILRQLLFEQPGYNYDWPSVKWKLSGSFNINIDSVEAVNRGLSYYWTTETDPVSKNALNVFSENAVRYPIIWANYVQMVQDDTARFVLSVARGENMPMKAFRTIIPDGGNGFIDFRSTDRFSGVFTSREYSYPYYYTEYAMGGLVKDGFIQESEFPLGTATLATPWQGWRCFRQNRSIFSDTSGVNDVSVWGIQLRMDSYDRADVNRNWDVSPSDAVLASKWILNEIAPPFAHLGDVNGNGLFDPDDPWLIFNLGIWGGSSYGLGKKMLSDSIANGTIIVKERTERNSATVEVSFVGNVGKAKRFAGSFRYNSRGYALERVSLEDSSEISGFAELDGKVNVLSYPKEFKEGKIVTLYFRKSSGGNLNLSLSPLAGNNFLQSGESVKVEISGLTGLENSEMVPDKFSLSQNYPNPFNPSTKISFTLPQRSRVTLKIYDILGKEIATLVDGEVSAGSHEAVFDALGFSSGIYFYRFSAENLIETKRMILLK